MVIRSSKHLLRNLLSQVHQDDMPAAISHYLNCLLGSSLNADPTPSPQTVPEDLFTAPASSMTEPEYLTLTPDTLRAKVIQEVGSRYRWKLDDEYLESLGKERGRQMLRELSMRVGFQLRRRDYAFERGVKVEGGVNGGVSVGGKAKKEKKKNTAVNGNVNGAGKVEGEAKLELSFGREDVLCLVPIVKATAPSVSCSFLSSSRASFFLSLRMGIVTDITGQPGGWQKHSQSCDGVKG
jgi:protein TIF31